MSLHDHELGRILSLTIKSREKPTKIAICSCGQFFSIDGEVWLTAEEMTAVLMWQIIREMTPVITDNLLQIQKALIAGQDPQQFLSAEKCAHRMILAGSITFSVQSFRDRESDRFVYFIDTNAPFFRDSPIKVDGHEALRVLARKIALKLGDGLFSSEIENFIQETVAWDPPLTSV